MKWFYFKEVMRLRTIRFKSLGLVLAFSLAVPSLSLGSELSAVSAPQVSSSEALQKWLTQLERYRMRSYYQGIYVETLDGQKILAEHNSDETFNPASVMKMATSFFALSELGPERRFETTVYGERPLDDKAKALTGNLYIVSDGDPSLRTSDALALGRSLSRRGLRRVNGDLVIIGPFALYNDRYAVRSSGDLLRRSFSRVGILVKGKVKVASAQEVDLSTKIVFMKRESDRLRDILFLQNAHSINEIADQIGEILGGPEALEQFLVQKAGIPPEEIHVERASGLQSNRMTPRAAVKLLRALNTWLETHEMRMQDIMPLAGIDEGTLFGRFRDPEVYGAVLGKTGTNPAKDGGVSALAGMAITRENGPVLYAIFNSHGRITTYRRWQDHFLKQLIEENGGPGDSFLARGGPAPITLAAYWAPSEYWSSLSEESLRHASTRKAKPTSHKVTKSRQSNSRQAGN
ncbi:MAG: D-alanyl-D-alanine carboxypeptidase [Terriglobia bacterium]